MLAWMGYAMLAAAALGVAAALVDFSVAGRFERRRALWAGVFLVSAIGPIAFSLTRGIPAVVAEEDTGATPSASERPEPILSDRVLGSAWLAASAVLALWLVATQRGLRRRLRGCPSRIVDGERVLVSPDFGPAIAGVVRSQIVLPEWALAMRESDRRIIVAHETEHRRAHDPLLAAMALFLAAAFPWNAALWWQLRRLRLAIEIDCDRRVVARHGHDPHTYGMLLLATRERAYRVTPSPALAMAAMRSGLGRRVEALVDGRSQPVGWRLGAVAAAVILTAGIASVPAPQLSLIRASVVEPSAVPALPLSMVSAPVAVTSAATAPVTISTTPAPARSRQASNPSEVSAARPRRSAGVSPSGSVARVVVTGTSVRVLLPRREGRLAHTDSSLWHRLPVQRGGGRDGSASILEERWVTMSSDRNRRILRTSSGSYRAMLLPIPDSLRPSPR